MNSVAPEVSFSFRRSGSGHPYTCGGEQNASRFPCRAGHLRFAADQRRGNGAVDEEHELGGEAISDLSSLRQGCA
jgi:hypothetical protein